MKYMICVIFCVAGCSGSAGTDLPQQIEFQQKLNELEEAGASIAQEEAQLNALIDGGVDQ